MFDRGLRGKVAVVTGAARGIGRACALALADEGAKVALLDLDEAQSSAIADVLRATQEMGAECIYCRADVTNTVEIQNAIR